MTRPVGGIVGVGVVGDVVELSDAFGWKPHNTVSAKWTIFRWCTTWDKILKTYYLGSKGFHVVCKWVYKKSHKLWSCVHSPVAQMTLNDTDSLEKKIYRPVVHFCFPERIFDQFWCNLCLWTHTYRYHCIPSITRCITYVGNPAVCRCALIYAWSSVGISQPTHHQCRSQQSHCELSSRLSVEQLHFYMWL